MIKPMTLNLSKMKKVGSDEHSSTFLHPDGHHMVIAHSGISALQRKQMEKLPIHKYAEGTPDAPVGEDVESPAANSTPITPVESMQDPLPVATSTPMPDQMSAPKVTADMETAHPEAPSPIPNITSVPSTAIESEEKSVKGALGAEEAASKNIGNAWKDYSAQTAKITPVEDIIKSRQKSDQDFQQKLVDQKINPDRYLQNMGTGKKIGTAIGMLFGGLAQGWIGGENPAVAYLNKAINEDIEAQKNEQGKTMNLWKMNREATGSDIQANLLTRNQLLGATEAKIKMFQAQTGGAEAQLKLAPMLLDIQRQKSENNIRLALTSPPEKTGMNNIDPAQLVPHIVPADRQQKVFDEIDAAQNTARNSKGILDEFNNAAHTVNAVDFVPGMENRHQKALHAMMGPTFKDVEGTVRQAAMDNMFHNITPQFGDNAKTIATKRNALESYLQSKSSAPVAKGYGLDLSRFNSTHIQKEIAPVQKTMNGVNYQQVPGGWKRVQ